MMVSQILSRCHGDSRKYWDTSDESESCLASSANMMLLSSPHQTWSNTYVPAESGLRGTELRIDCTVSDGPCCPAHVVTYAEAKFTLSSATDQAEAVGQLWVSILSN